MAALARLWDRLGLLHLEGSGLGEGEGLQYVRIFNARKNSTTDRYPPVALEMLRGTAALKEFLETSGPSAEGALAGPRRLPPILASPPSQAFICFKSILQGDHLGVELATAAHREYLHQSHCLCDASELRADRPFPSTSHVSGLVIDDLFSVSVQSARCAPNATIPGQGPKGLLHREGCRL